MSFVLDDLDTGFDSAKVCNVCCKSKAIQDLFKKLFCVCMPRLKQWVSLLADNYLSVGTVKIIV